MAANARLAAWKSNISVDRDKMFTRTTYQAILMPFMRGILRTEGEDVRLAQVAEMDGWEKRGSGQDDELALPTDRRSSVNRSSARSR